MSGASASRESSGDSGVTTAMDAATLARCPFRIAFMSSPLALAIATPDGRFLEVNDCYAALLGRDPVEIVGRSFAEFTHPDDVQIGVTARDSAMRGETTSVQVEKRYLRPNGAVVWARVTSTLQRDENGRPLQFITQIVDLTEHRRATAALQQREAQYRTLVEHAPEAIVVLDADTGLFVDANRNAERLFKLTRQQLLKCGPEDVGPPRQPDGALTNLAQRQRIAAALAGATETYERVLRDSAGRDFYCELRLVRLPSESQRLVRASIIEITDRKRADVRQQRLIRELNHRVKNTLSSILTLARQSVMRARTLEDFDRGFTGRLTALSRAHEALTSAQWEQIELDALTRQVLGPHLVERQPQLTYSGERILLPARAVVPLGMALHELATNALKHGALSNDRGRVAVTWRLCEKWLELSWEERGGRAIGHSMHEGTGIELIRGFIAYELGGQVRFDPQPDCFTATFRVPLER